MNNKLKDLLMCEARERGICAPGFKQMRCSDVNELIAYYLQHPDWCLERGYPDLQTLTKEFANIEDKGVYINKVFHDETFSHLQTYIFHNCKGTINVEMDYKNAIIPMLYFANGCSMEVRCHQRNQPAIRVPLYSFGDNEIITSDNNSVHFIHHKFNLR